MIKTIKICTIVRINRVLMAVFFLNFNLHIRVGNNEKGKKNIFKIIFI